MMFSTKGYFKGLAAELMPCGYAAEPPVGAVWRGTAAMVKNDGSRLNREAFWQTFEAVMPGWKTEHRAVTDTFYRGISMRRSGTPVKTRSHAR